MLKKLLTFPAEFGIIFPCFVQRETTSSKIKFEYMKGGEGK